MRLLIIDDEARARIRAVIEYARVKLYHLGDPPATNDPERIAQINTFRCIFTYSVLVAIADVPEYSVVQGQEVMSRQLTVEIPSHTALAHPAAVFMIAQEFGFTGWDGITWQRAPDGWLLKHQHATPEHPGNVSVFQIIAGTSGTRH